MSALLQYERGVSDNNSMFVNQRVNEARQMRGMSNLTKNNIQEAFRNQQADSEKKSAISSAKDQAGEFLNDARDVYKTGKKLNSIYDDIGSATRSFRRGQFRQAEGIPDPNNLTGDRTGLGESGRPTGVAGEGDVGSELERAVAPGGESGADVNAILDFGESLGNRVVGGVGAGSRLGQAGQQAITGTRDFLQGANETADAVRSVAMGGDIGSGIGAGIKSVSKIGGALDTLGKAGEGLSVAGGVSDIIDDADGGFSKMNTGEKVGNVAGITAGATGLASLTTGLESAGAMLDATGVGAEIGVGLQVAGLLASGVGAIGDYIGSKEKQKTKAPQISQSAPAPKPVDATSTPQISTAQMGGIATPSY